MAIFAVGGVMTHVLRQRQIMQTERDAGTPERKIRRDLLLAYLLVLAFVAVVLGFRYLW